MGFNTSCAFQQLSELGQCLKALCLSLFTSKKDDVTMAQWPRSMVSTGRQARLRCWLRHLGWATQLLRASTSSHLQHGKQEGRDEEKVLWASIAFLGNVLSYISYEVYTWMFGILLFIYVYLMYIFVLCMCVYIYTHLYEIFHHFREGN